MNFKFSRKTPRQSLMLYINQTNSHLELGDRGELGAQGGELGGELGVQGGENGGRGGELTCGGQQLGS